MYEDETERIGSGNRSFGKLQRGWMDGAKIGENGGGCCGRRVLSEKSSLRIYRAPPET